MDSLSLTKFMHNRGINMRYLGSLIHICKYSASKIILATEAV